MIFSENLPDNIAEIVDTDHGGFHVGWEIDYDTGWAQDVVNRADHDWLTVDIKGKPLLRFRPVYEGQPTNFLTDGRSRRWEGYWKEVYEGIVVVAT